ncbi:MAG TPA: type IV toxin-antitoxin system AbiEi family antitoxin domain-containing protein [Candidatus Obscuribacterales bacterium]
MKKKEAFEKLYRLAERQLGCFTASQAQSCGYSPQAQYHHVQAGDWVRVARGICCLKYFPTPVRVDLMICYLWTCDRNDVPQGVFSHETAFSLHPYSVWRPTEKHITVPRSFRRRGAPPEPVRLYKRDLDKSDVTIIEWVAVTKPVRTVVDLLMSGFVQQHHLRDFVRTSLEMGIITHRNMSETRLSLDEWEQLVGLLKRINYDRIEDIQVWSGIRETA